MLTEALAEYVHYPCFQDEDTTINMDLSLPLECFNTATQGKCASQSQTWQKSLKHH